MPERRNGKAPTAPVDVRALEAETAVAQAQAAAEGVDLTGFVTFRGRKFRLGPCDGITPMLKFAKAAAKGVETDDPAGLAAMEGIIDGCFLLAPSCGTCEACMAEDYDGCPSRDLGDGPKFWRLAEAVAAGPDELMEVVQAALEHSMARPTSAPSGSSSPAPRTSANSKGRSSSLPAAFAAAEAAGDMVGVADVLH